MTFYSLNIKNFIGSIKNTRRLFWFLGTHVFFVVLVLILFDLLFGGWLLYKYVILAKLQEPNAISKSFEFEEAAYQEIIDELTVRKKNFDSILEGEYADPF